MEKNEQPRPAQEVAGSESGFSLIELLVVIVIISILAAISIPIFIHQREKGWRAQVESSLKNGATIMQAWSTENGGDYTLPAGVGPDAADEMDWMSGDGWPPTEAVTIDVVEADSDGFCLAGTHVQLDTLELEYDSGRGAPVEGDCT